MIDQDCNSCKFRDIKLAEKPCVECEERITYTKWVPRND